MSNITIQINREDDSQVSEIDSDTGDSEKCEMTDSQEKEDIENEEVEENDKTNHVEFAEDYIEESLEEDSNGEVGSGELEIEEVNKNIAKIKVKEAIKVLKMISKVKDNKHHYHHLQTVKQNSHSVGIYHHQSVTVKFH